MIESVPSFKILCVVYNYSIHILHTQGHTHNFPATSTLLTAHNSQVPKNYKPVGFFSSIMTARRLWDQSGGLQRNRASSPVKLAHFLFIAFAFERPFSTFVVRQMRKLRQRGQ